jgi:hypothetical protein
LTLGTWETWTIDVPAVEGAASVQLLGFVVSGQLQGFATWEGALLIDEIRFE